MSATKRPRGGDSENASTVVQPPLKRTRTELSQAVHGTNSVFFQAKTFEQLTHVTPIECNKLYACVGANREAILLDMTSTSLKEHFNNFLKAIDVSEQPTQSCDDVGHLHEDAKKEEGWTLNGKKPHDLLKNLVSFVRGQIDSESTKLEELKTIVYQYNDKSLAWCQCKVYLESFLEVGKGVCRQIALDMGYLLAQLIHYLQKQNAANPVNNNLVYRYRSDLVLINGVDLTEFKDIPKKIIHAVIIYEAENGHRYLLDGTRDGIIIDLTTWNPKTETNLLVQLYYYPYDLNGFIAEINEAYDKLKRPVPDSKEKMSEKVSP